MVDVKLEDLVAEKASEGDVELRSAGWNAYEMLLDFMQAV